MALRKPARVIYLDHEPHEPPFSGTVVFLLGVMAGTLGTGISVVLWSLV